MSNSKLALHPAVITLLVVFTAACSSTGKKQAKAADQYPAATSAAVTAQPEQTQANPALTDALKLLASNQYADAENALLSLSQAQPGLAAGWLNLGLLYTRTQRLEEAEQAFIQATKLAPGSVVILNELGIVRRKLNRLAAAEQAYKRALALDKDYAPAHRNLGILYDLHLGKPQLAMAHYRRYIELQPQDKVVNLWIAQLEYSGS